MSTEPILPSLETTMGALVVSSWLSVCPVGLRMVKPSDLLRFQFLWLGFTMVMGLYL
jgi:hypothetical protein